jgi:hypothetical protein
MIDKREWGGLTPSECDICGVVIVDVFIDGKTVQGFWSIMCLRCHEIYGVGLGAGRGQLYRRSSNRWVKAAG